jgi:hypothetical protein
MAVQLSRERNWFSPAYFFLSRQMSSIVTPSAIAFADFSLPPVLPFSI